MRLRSSSLRRALELMAQARGDALTRRLAWIRQSITFIEGMAPYNDSNKEDLIAELQTVAQTALDAARYVSSGSLNADPRYSAGF